MKIMPHTSPTDINHWLENQRRVWDKDGPMPEMLASAGTSEIQNDEAYQHAAALFYREQYLQAAAEIFSDF